MRLSRIGALLVLVALAAAGPAAGQQGAGLRPLTLTFQLLVQGSALGTVTTTLAREGEEWVSRSAMQGPATQESEVRFRGDLTPVSTRQSVRQGPTTIETDLRYAEGRITGSAKLPEQMGGERQIDATVEKGTLLPEMDAWYLASAALEPGKALQVSQFNLVSGAAMAITYTVAGTESVTVPAGTFETYRVEVSGIPQQVSLWLRREAPHIVVKQEFRGQPVSIVLQSVKHD